MQQRLHSRLRDWLKGVQWTATPDGVAVDGILVLLFAAVVSIACFSPWPWEDSPWVALAAVATFFAAGVALWLGWREGTWRREERREREARADVLLAMQTGITGQVLQMIITVRDALAAGDPPDRYHDESLVMKEAVRLLREIDHVRLLEVDRDTGVRLARCIANMNGIVGMLWLAADNETVRRQAFENTRNAHFDLSEVMEFLYVGWPGNPLLPKKAE